MYEFRFFAIFFIIFRISIGSGDIQCPDKKSSCADDMTCCQLPTKQWGCCPMQRAVCCSDGLHCCPEMTTCNLEEMACENQTTNGRIYWHETMPSTPAPPSDRDRNDIVCPDGKKTCQEGNTCCKLGDPPDWGCCQFPHAVCCPDHVHCCPNGNVCNGSKCSKKIIQNSFFVSSTPASTLRRVPNLAQTKVRCPNGAFCGDDSTCCLMETGQWGCCPFVEAVCCQDKIHCCPGGSECNPSTGQCISVGSRTRHERKWMKKYQAILNNPIICPDQESQCPENTTCCEMDSGEYGCCPFPSAVCCSDKMHCCPEGMTCDVEHQKCDNGRIFTRLSKKTPAYPINDVTCPDHQSHCPSGATCCPLSDTHTSYGCCPLPQAVCCEDYIHCCPTGTTCDVEQEACITGRGKKMPWFLKFKPKHD